MEQFDGMAILTTNLRANVDEAFVRRLDAIIDFPMPEQEDRLRPGAQLDPDLRSRVHTAPADLRRRLPRPPKHNRYVTVGGHIGIIDQTYQVHDVIHLHDNR